MALESTLPLGEMRTSNFPKGKGRSVRKADIILTPKQIGGTHCSERPPILFCCAQSALHNELQICQECVHLVTVFGVQLQMSASTVSVVRIYFQISSTTSRLFYCDNTSTAPPPFFLPSCYSTRWLQKATHYTLYIIFPSNLEHFFR
jgi:hypothetical protein